MKLKNLILFILAIATPFIISLGFILAGHPDKNGRISITGEETKTPEGYQALICESERKLAESAASVVGSEVPQGPGSDCTPTSEQSAQLGAAAYYKVDVSSPASFYGAVNGVGFNEGWGYQCVAAFKEFMFSYSGRYVAAAGGAAKGYAYQQSQIEPLGFKWYSGRSGMQDGDWAIFSGGTYGHVAMYYQGKFFGQNQGASDPNTGNAFNLRDLGSYADTIVGYYRPNNYQKNDPAPNPTPSPTPTNPGSSTGTTSYNVQQGDTLGGIALKNGWWGSTNGLYGNNGYAQRLADQNGIKWRGLIYPNQTINRAQ